MSSPLRPNNSATLTATVFTVIAIELGNARLYVADAAQLFFATIAAVLLGGVVLVWQTRALRPMTPRWLGVIALVFGLCSLQIRGVLQPGPFLALGIIAALGLLAILFDLIRPKKVRVRHVALLGALATGLALRFFELRVIPIDPERSDMIPLVIVALRELGRGLPPYRMYHVPWDVPLTYLPLNWLAYGPTYVLGIDPRWTSTLAELSILGAIFFVARKRREKGLRDAAILLWAAWFISHSMIGFDGQIAAAVQWAALAWVLALAIEMHRVTPFAVGAAVATTTLSLPLLPTLTLAWLFGRHHAGAQAARPRRRRPALQAIAIAIGVAALFIVPSFVSSPSGFIDGVVLWFNDLDRFPRTKWLQNQAWASHPGFCAVFWTLGIEAWMKPLQAALVALFAFRFRKRLIASRTRAVLGHELVSVLTVFLLFNPMVWGYLWEAVVALALITLASQSPRAEHQNEQNESGPLPEKQARSID